MIDCAPLSRASTFAHLTSAVPTPRARRVFLARDEDRRVAQPQTLGEEAACRPHLRDPQRRPGRHRIAEVALALSFCALLEERVDGRVATFMLCAVLLPAVALKTTLLRESLATGRLTGATFFRRHARPLALNPWHRS